MKTPNYLFETSWEVCNMVGGIYTVLSTKADEVKQRIGDNYITIGPDVVKESHETLYFVEDTTLFPEWREKVLEQGLKVRIGRWKLDSRPLAILIDYTSLYPKKNEILSHLWEAYRLDSLRGQWDYIEPVLFGYAAGQVIESFVKWNIEDDENIVAHFHEWMTGSGVLYLKENCPQIATAFTTHATYLGRAISGNGLALYNDLQTFEPAEMANRFNIVSQQSMEYNAAQNADVFTTVSEVTAEECKQFLQREPDVITINGINETYVADENTASEKRKVAREKITEILNILSGTKASDDAFYILNSGRYEFKNKGIDLFINALGRLNKSAELNKEIVAVIAVPANISGIYKELEYRREGKKPIEGHTDLPCTHHIFGYEYDAVLNSLRENGLNNNSEDKVKVMFVPSYLNGNDGVFNLKYNDFLYAFDLTVFPSYYEPWGYTPMESIAHGIPTVTTDLAGFGRYIQDEKFENESVAIVHREEGNGIIVTDDIVKIILNFTSKDENQIKAVKKNAFELVGKFEWNELINNYLEAYDIALDKLRGRDYMKQAKKYNEILRNFHYEKQDTPNWKRIVVEPNYSEEMQKLQELSQNLWWCWDVDATELFSSIDPQAWKAVEHNPIALMKNLSKSQIEALENDAAFVEKLNSTYARFKEYMSAQPADNHTIAYFSMEYGLTKSLKIYSGGLGILAGDYLKQASDSNANMLAIGLLYRYGYFAQDLSVWGEQLSQYIPQDFSYLPMEPVCDENGEKVIISIAFPGRSVYARAWRVPVGRISLYLLDTDIDENSPEDRGITGKLYGGDSEMRIKQEMFLGIGGIRLMDKINVKPTIYHCNEGHAAFCGLERLSVYITRHNLDFSVAKELVRTSTLFTTHTPVPAGHDVFEEHLMRTYLSHYPGRMNISWNDFMNLGKIRHNDPYEKFSMSVLATNLSQEVNGVSKIHGRVSREMFQQMWPGYFAEENHIGYVTNGVHLPTWTDFSWQRLYREVLGKDYVDVQSDPNVWANINNVSDETIWNIKKDLKHRLTEYLKVKVVEDMQRRQESPSLIINTIENFNENALIIGFARRFATYKRAHLLFNNIDRLAELLNNPEKPVVFLFAGKAHPNDKAGQDLIKMIIETSRRKEFAGKVIFLNNYDMELGKILTSSVDIWMNTPTRPLEASGTSGEKAVMNGTLNLSVLDGWWAEGFRPQAGWALQEERTYSDQRYQDELDAETIYNLIENEIVSLYFNRNEKDIPTQWVQYIKNDLMQIAPHYTMKRMLDDYFAQYYNKLIERTDVMRENRYQKAFEIAAWKKKVEASWDKIEVESIKIPDPNVRSLNFGDVIIAEVTLKTPGLDRGDVGVEIVFGGQDGKGNDKLMQVEQLQIVDSGEGWARYYINLPLNKAGVFNYTFRIYPTNEMLPHRQDFALVKWI